MMKRVATVLVILFMAASAHAFFLHGSVPFPGCSFTSSSSTGSCISTLNTSQYLSASGYSIQFSTTDPYGDCTSWSHTNCLYVWQTGTPSGSPWYPIVGNVTSRIPSIVVTKAILCNGDTTPSGNHFYYSVNDYGGAITWFSINASSIYQTIQPCSGIAQYGDFVVNGTTNYYSLTSACSAATANGTVEAKAMPNGMPFWSSDNGRTSLTGCLINQAGVTVTLDSGYISVAGSCDGGAGGSFCVNAANVTISGAGAEVSGFDEATVNDAINMKRDLANNTTIEGSTGNYLVIDCLPAFGGNDSILSGANVGTTTISHVKVQRCGGGVSGAHSVYLSWGGDPVPNPTYCHTVSDFLVVDSAGDTPAVKFDDQCENAQGTLINSAVYCTSSGAGGQCSENQPYDEQCGGNQLVQNNLLEQYGSIASSPDASYMAKVAWGYLGIGGCPLYPTSGTDAIRFDKDIFIYDGVKDLISGGTVWTVCGGYYAHQYCNANSPGSNVSSSTTLTVGTGFKQLSVPAGTSIIDGAPVTITNGANSMLGTVVMGYSCGRDAGVFTCFTGAISGSTLTVSATDNGPTGEQCGTYAASGSVSCTLAVGEVVSGTGVPASTIITAQITGSSGDTCPAADCNGQKGTYSISTSGTVLAEYMGAHGYDSVSGNLLIYSSTASGSGSFNSWTVNYNKATGVCVTSSEIIAGFNSGNPSNQNSQMIMGPGDYTDSGCTGVGADTNTYYDTANATTHNGRYDACAVLSQIANSGWTNCNTAPNSHGAFPYVPDYTQNPPTQAAQAAEAATLGCSGAGTAASPITACP